jgi:hypothetical protein
LIAPKSGAKTLGLNTGAEHLATKRHKKRKNPALCFLCASCAFSRP